MLTKQQKGIIIKNITEALETSLRNLACSEAIENTLNFYRKKINEYCKVECKKAFYECVSISGTKEVSVDPKIINLNVSDWVYRFPITVIEKSYRIYFEDIAEGKEFSLLQLALDNACKRILDYYEYNQEEGYTFVLRQNLEYDYWTEPTTKDKIISTYLRTTKIPDVSTEIGLEIMKKVVNQGFTFKNDFRGCLRKEEQPREILNIQDET